MNIFVGPALASSAVCSNGMPSPSSVQMGRCGCREPDGGGDTECADSLLPARVLHHALAFRIMRSRQRRSGPEVEVEAQVPVVDMAAFADPDANL